MDPLTEAPSSINENELSDYNLRYISDEKQ